MSFMQPEIEFGTWFIVDGPRGTEYVPTDIVGELDLADYQSNPLVVETFEIPSELADYCDNSEAYSIEKRDGWGARLSAPGYLDCTPWTIFDSEEEAQQYLANEVDDDTPHEPEEGDITTEDHRHFYQYGKLVLTVGEDVDHKPALREFMKREKFWPNCWFISDHGNAHLIDLSE